MHQNHWKPHVTVATVVERKDDNNNPQYLMVHEISEGKAVYNQPAGHLEEGENLLSATIRETLEETAWHIKVTAYLGLYHYSAPNGIIYLRHGFAATPIACESNRDLDEGIIEALWMGYEEIIYKANDMRSEKVIQMLNDYRSGEHYTLSILKD